MAESNTSVHALTAEGIATGAPTVGTLSVRMRTNLSFQQLKAAARLAQEVAAVEKQNVGKEFGNFYETILGSSLGCVVLSLAAAKVDYINELFADRVEHFSPHDRVLLRISYGRSTRPSVCWTSSTSHAESARAPYSTAALNMCKRWTGSSS